MTDLTVKYKNSLNSVALKSFNSIEMDLFFSICARMKNKGLVDIKFYFDELKDLINYKPTSLKRFMSDLESLYDKMLRLTYRTQHKDGIVTKFVLFNSFTINPIEKYVELAINPKLEYILNELSKEFTQFELQEFTKLSSSYSKTMYRLLKQYKSTGFYTVKLSDFRDLLDVPDCYKMCNIDQQIFKPLKKDFKDIFSFFEIKKIKAKKGNKIERLEFTFLEKMEAEPVGKTPKVTLHNWLEN